MRVIYQCLTKSLSYGSALVDKPKALLMAPTGVAAINVDATTIHTAFCIPVGHFGSNLPPLSNKMKSCLRNRLSGLKIIITDEILMISNNLLFYVHLRLNEICKPFAGISVITVGDFLQLPPVGGRPVYADYKDNWQNFQSPWKLFKIFELTEVMRQCGDAEFIDLLNKVRTEDTQSCDIRLLESIITWLNQNHPTTHKMPFIFLLKMQVQKTQFRNVIFN